MPLTLDLNSELEEWVRSEATRNGLDETSFVMKTLERQRTQASTRPRALPTEEAELLHKINVGLPEEFWNEYRDLIGKRRAEFLTDQEHTRLLELSDRVESDNVERITHLIQLAQIRNTSLDDLMLELGIRPRDV